MITFTTPGVASGTATFVLDLSAITPISGTRPNAGTVSADVVIAINGINYTDISNGPGFPNTQDYLYVYRCSQGIATEYGNFEFTVNHLIQTPLTSDVAVGLLVQSVCSASSLPEIE